MAALIPNYYYLLVSPTSAGATDGFGPRAEKHQESMAYSRVRRMPPDIGSHNNQTRGNTAICLLK